MQSANELGLSFCRIIWWSACQSPKYAFRVNQQRMPPTRWLGPPSGKLWFCCKGKGHLCYCRFVYILFSITYALPLLSCNIIWLKTAATEACQTKLVVKFSAKLKCNKKKMPFKNCKVFGCFYDVGKKHKCTKSTDIASKFLGGNLISLWPY